MDRLAIADALREIGRRLRLRGDTGFRARAYERGADALRGLDEDLDALIARGELQRIRHIGPGLAAQVEQLARTGTSDTLERLRAEVPRSVLEIAEAGNISLGRARKLNSELGVNSVADLQSLCTEGRVRELKGFGQSTELRILDAIARHEAHHTTVLLLDAIEAAGPLFDRLGSVSEKVEAAGSVRRWHETVGSLDLVIGTNASAKALDRVASDPRVVESLQRTQRTISVRLADGLVVRAQATEPGTFATALLRATGSDAHLARIQEIAREKGLSFGNDGSIVDARGQAVTFDDERDIYRTLGLSYVPPELREGRDEFAPASRDAFADLVALRDIRGLVHCHTTYSDGKHRIEEMARAADTLGIQYLTVTDHSPTASYAGGVTLDRLKAQWEEIDRVQDGVRVRLLRGTESDILADGSLDYPDSVLERFDIIIASVHSRMKMDESEMTRRIVRAMRHPAFKIWGHALGRRLLDRPPFACRVEEVLDTIAQSRAAIEVNGDPYRLDMEPRWIREARRRGIPFVISTDAHSTRGLANLPFGVAMARRGGLRVSEVLNTREVSAFMQAVRPAA